MIYSGLWVTTSVSAPILFAAGCASALIFGLRAFAKFLRITKKDKAIWLAKVFDVLSLVLFGLTLITFGVLAFVGLLPGLSVLFNIGFIVSGVLFVGKGCLTAKYGSENKLINRAGEIKSDNEYLNYSDSTSTSDLNEDVHHWRLIVPNTVSVLLNGIGLAAGIIAVITSGGFIATPFLFVLGLAMTIIFGFRTYASIMRTLNINYRQVSAKIFENMSLGIVALGLFGFGISLFVFPAFFASLGVHILFFKTISLIAAFLFSLATVTKIQFGSRADIYDSKIEIDDADKTNGSQVD